MITIPFFISIVGLLAAIAIPNFVKARNIAQANARVAQTKSLISQPATNGAQLSQEAWQLWQEHKLDLATAKFQQAIQLAPGDANAWNGLGWSQFNAGHNAEAEKAFQQAVAIEPTQPGALNGLGQIYLSQRQYADAEKYLLQAAPQAPAAWFGLARLYLLEDKFDQAETWAQKLVDSGQADDVAQQMLQAAKDKKISARLRKLIEPPQPNNHQAMELQTHDGSTRMTLQSSQPVSVLSQHMNLDVKSGIMTVDNNFEIKTQPTNDALGFDPVRERAVTAALDFDSGKTGTVPELGDALGKQGIDRVLTNIKAFERAGLDFMEDTNLPDALFGLGLTVLPLSTTAWDSSNAQQISAQLKAAPEQQFFEFPTTTNFPATYAIQTREGGRGILQITGFTENPRGVKIRYKLVQPSAAQVEEMLAKRAARDEFQFRWVAAEGDTNSSADILPAVSDRAGQPPLRVLREVVLSSLAVESAGFSQYQGEQKTLEVFLSPRGNEKFAQATRENVGRQLAIVWRGKVITAPIVQSEIPGGRVPINGRFTDAEAQQLLDWLNHRQTPSPKN